MGDDGFGEIEVKIARTISEVRAAVGSARANGTTIGFVPTMGFLHEGHLSLIDLARQDGCDFIVVSIFVNPTQFGPNEDLDRYPRDQARDVELLEGRDVDLLFLPSAEEIYPRGFATSVHVKGVAVSLEGSRRPGHFDGVATVVLKLFNIVQPDIAVFGQKDAQQCAVIAQLVRDLDIAVKLLIGPTVREADGLAMSSRNAYLVGPERQLATALREALERGAETLARGAGEADEVQRSMRDGIAKHPGITVDYLELVDPTTFLPPADLNRALLLVGAVRIGPTRLIDNIPVPFNHARSAASEIPQPLTTTSMNQKVLS